MIIIIVIILKIVLITMIITSAITGLTFTSTTLGELLAPPQCSMLVVLLGGPLGVGMSLSGVSVTF